MKRLHKISGRNGLEPNYFSISTDNKTLISNAHSLISREQFENVNFWNLLTGELIKTLNFRHDYMAVGCYEHWLLGIQYNADCIMTCNLATEKQFLILDAAPQCIGLESQIHTVTPIAISPFEPIFACGNFTLNASHFGEVKVYNLLMLPIIQNSSAVRLPAQSFRWQPEQYPSCNSSILLSPDSNIVLSQAVRTGYDVHHLWDVQTGTLIRSSSANSNVFAECLAVNELGQILACGYVSEKIQVWDVHTNQVICSLNGNFPITMSIDGQYLAYSCGDSKVVLRDLVKNREVGVIDISSASIKKIALSPDGKILAIYKRDQVIEIWHIFL